MQEEPNLGGRPEGDTYTEEIALDICDRLSNGRSLRSVCNDEGMPSKHTVLRWLRDHEGFRAQYARAKEEAADAMADEIIDISDDGTNDFMEVTRGKSTYTVVNTEAIQRSKLRVDTRKWLMAKAKPKKYGDKLDLTSDGNALPTPIYGGLSEHTTPKSRRN